MNRRLAYILFLINYFLFQHAGLLILLKKKKKIELKINKLKIDVN